jgi:hypothetical protein
MSVTQNKDSLYLNTTIVNDKNERSNASARYALNGALNERMVNNDLKVTGRFNWSEDKTSLLKVQDYLHPQEHSEPFRRVKEIWTLSSDGRLLTVEQEVQLVDANGYSVKAVYKKN